MHRWLAVGVLSTSALAAHAADNVAPELAQGLVGLSAQMNEMAKVCKHMPAAQLERAQNEQKAAALKDLQISAADYERLYAEAAQRFQSRWASMGAQQQRTTCDQMKNMPANLPSTSK